MAQIRNGMPADDLLEVRWIKSAHSGSTGNCVEMARLHDGSIAVRNSRFPHGPALVYTRQEIQALVLGARDGDFDSLLA